MPTDSRLKFDLLQHFDDSLDRTARIFFWLAYPDFQCDVTVLHSSSKAILKKNNLTEA